MRKNRLTVALGIASALAMTLAACSSGSSTSTESSAAAPSAPAASAAPAGSAAAIAVPQQYLDNGINVASDLAYPPMEMTNEAGEPTGFDIDLAYAIGQVLGVNVVVEKQEFDTMIPSLQSNKHDMVMSTMNDTAERQKVLSFVDYFQGGMNLLVKKGNPEGITTITDLCGKPTAIQSGTSQRALLEKISAEQCNGNDIQISEFPSDTDAQNAVRAGKVIADVTDAPVAVYTATTAGGGEYFEVVQDPAFPNGYESALVGVGILKDNAELIEAVRQALTILLENGTYQTLLEKYDLAPYAVSEITVNGGQ